MPEQQRVLQVIVHAPPAPSPKGRMVEVWQIGRGWRIFDYDGHSAHQAAVGAVAACLRGIGIQVAPSVAEALVERKPKCECCHQELPDA